MGFPERPLLWLHNDYDYIKGVLLIIIIRHKRPESMRTQDTYNPVKNYNYVKDTKVSVSIKKTNANKWALSENFLSEILKVKTLLSVLSQILAFSNQSKQVLKISQ